MLRSLSRCRRGQLRLRSLTLVLHYLEHAATVFLLLLFLTADVGLRDCIQFCQLFLSVLQILVIEVEHTGTVPDASEAAEGTSPSADAWQTREATAAERWQAASLIRFRNGRLDLRRDGFRLGHGRLVLGWWNYFESSSLGPHILLRLFRGHRCFRLHLRDRCRLLLRLLLNFFRNGGRECGRGDGRGHGVADRRRCLHALSLGSGCSVGLCLGSLLSDSFSLSLQLLLRHSRLLVELALALRQISLLLRKGVISKLLRTLVLFHQSLQLRFPLIKQGLLPRELRRHRRTFVINSSSWLRSLRHLSVGRTSALY